MLRPRQSRAVNPQQRRKLSLKQIRAGFGGKRRKAAAKSRRSAPRHSPARPKRPRRTANSKPRRRNASPKVVYKTRVKRVYVTAKPKRRTPAKRRRGSARTAANPYLMTLSPVLGANPFPKRRRKSMAAKRRRKVASARSRSRKGNPTRRRSARPATRRHRSRNPFGESTNTMLKTGAGVFLGFSAGKKIPPMLGASMNSSPMMSLLSTAITAGVAAWIAKRFIPGPVATGVLWGGVGAVFNVAWNAWAPASIAGYAGVGNIGDIVPGRFPLPQIPVGMLGAGGVSPAMVAQAPVNMGAWGSAF